MSTRDHCRLSLSSCIRRARTRAALDGRPNLACALCVLCALFAGCAGSSGGSRAGANSRSPYAASEGMPRDTARSEQLAQAAAQLIDTDPAEAERLLREALAADLYNGPAHNNLGTLYLQRGELYEAANEFEWARKLMPGHPDPRLNLALTLERAGRVDDALATYDTALEVYPDHLPTIEAITRLQIRSGRTDDRTPRFLDEIALRSDEPWRSWARERRSLLVGAE